MNRAVTTVPAWTDQEAQNKPPPRSVPIGPAVDASETDHRPLRIGRFRNLWIASMFFNTGHLVQIVASSWVMVEINGSPLWVAFALAAPTLPLILLSLPAGAIADLVDRRRILMASAIVMMSAAAGLGALWVFGAVNPERLVGLGLLLGIGLAFFNPAMQGLVPDVVPVSELPAAIGLNSASGGIATGVGPVIGGIILATVGAAWAFAFAVICYGAVLVALARGRWPMRSDERIDSLRTSVATGLRYLRFTSGYPQLVLVGSLFGLTAGSLRALLPNLSHDILGGGSLLYGLWLGAFGGGVLLGGLTAVRAQNTFSARLIPTSIVGFGAVGAVVGISRNEILTGSMVFLAGLVWAWITSTLNTTFQLLAPPWVRGRIMGAFFLSVGGFVAIGGVGAGSLGSLIGVSGSLILCSTAAVAVGILSTRMSWQPPDRVERPRFIETRESKLLGQEEAKTPVMVVTTWTIDEVQKSRFLEVMDDLRRIRLRTGAYQWDLYRRSGDVTEYTEIYMVHSQRHWIQQQHRLDAEAIATIREADAHALEDQVRTAFLIRTNRNGN